MINGYDLEYAQEYLDNNIKLSQQAQDEVKEFLLREFVDNMCNKFLEATLEYNKIQCKRISMIMRKLSKIHRFSNIRYGYKEDFIREILDY